MDKHKPLLLEIGTEELPAAYIPLVQKQLVELAERMFAQQRIFTEGIKSYGTPRRLVLSISQVGTSQKELVQESKGPARQVAFAPDGSLTKAGEGFARSKGVGVDALEIRSTPQGEYVFAVQRQPGQPTATLLPELLPNLIMALSFPKSMRWGTEETRFARPIRWLLALFGEDVVEFTLAGVISGRTTWGHRFLAAEPLTITSPNEYLEKLEQAYVLVDPAKRREVICKQAQAAAAAIGGEVLFSEALLDEVTHLVEYPTAILGEFAEEYLSLPREVLITPMQAHQRYFPIVATGEAPLMQRKLLSYFIAIHNGSAAAAELVRAGNEKVLRARLADAHFFFNQDKKEPLAARVPALAGIVYQEELGTMADKVERLQGLVSALAGELGIGEPERGFALRAAYLAKADLVTQMVGEFPELQGIMGREYALLAGEAEAVATAIFEHYLPRFAGDDLPASRPGQLVALADKLDTLAGCFGIGLLPTGSEDPYALRRQALGIIAIIRAAGFDLKLTQVIELALGAFGGELPRPKAEVAPEIRNFILGRLRGVAEEAGIDGRALEAVLQTGEDSLIRMFARAQCLTGFTKRPEFADLFTGYSRAANLVSKAADADALLQAELLQEPAEQALAHVLRELSPQILEAQANQDWQGALTKLTELRAPIDNFFDGVMVMAPDLQVRQNRLALLREVTTLFHQVADFKVFA